MKKNLNFSFIMGYISYLDSSLLKKNQIEKIRNSKTVEDFLEMLKKEKYIEKEIKNFEEFEEELDKKFNNRLKELEKVCPRTNAFSYLYCYNDFLNFKILLKQKFYNNKVELSNFFPGSIKINSIKTALENKDFSSIKAPFDKAFCECFNFFLDVQNKKQAEIFIDKKTYQLLLKFSEKDEFLEKRTKLKITLKNINFCLRTLNYEENINNKELEFCLIDGGLIEKDFYIKGCSKGQKELFNFLNKINLDISGFKIKNLDELKTIEEIEKVEQKILDNFDSNYCFESFCFIPVFIYIKFFKREIEILKETMLKLKLNYI